MGRQLYQKQDLVYATDFAKRSIHIFKDLLEELDKSPDDNNPVFATGLRLLREQYHRDYVAVTDQVIADLSVDIMREGATREQRDRCIREYRRGYI